MRTNLERFIVERLLELDPTLSDSAGSAIYSRVVNPLLKRLGTDPLSVNIETFIVSRLEDEFPHLDVKSPASVLRDVLVSPLVLMLDPLRAEIDFLRKQSSLSDVDALTTEEMDALLDNIFVARHTGDFSRTTIRVYFSAPQPFSVDASVVFSTAAGIEFVAAKPRSYLSSELIRSGSQYYVDLEVRSIQMTEDAQVGVDSIKFVKGLSGVARVTNQFASSGGLSPETNLAFVSRAQQNLTERSLMTKRGIETVLRTNFSGLISVDVVGYGEPEMQRDVLQAEVLVGGAEGIGAFVHAANNLSTTALAGLPVTNKITVVGLATLPGAAKLDAAAVVGNYIRIADADGTFTTLLSRPRKIAAVSKSGNAYPITYTITLDDFVAYLDGVGLFDVNNSTPVVGMGFNLQARQGADGKLLVLDGADLKVLGAPLPFDEMVALTPPNGLPLAAIPGRDFLLLKFGAGVAYRCYPIHRNAGDGFVQLSRLDSFLTNKAAAPDAAPGNFSFANQLDETVEQEGVRVIACGTPKLSANDGTRTDGTTMETYGRAPGVKLVLPAGAPPVDLTQPCTIRLEGTQAGWAARGVLVGHYISVAYPKAVADFTGAWDELSAKFLWHAWGLITEVNDHDLKVTGMDWKAASLLGGALDLTTFPLLWTVYRGALEVVLPSGSVRTSYDEQMLVPAYRLVANDGLVDHRWVANYRTIGGFMSDGGGGLLEYASNQPFSSVEGMWIRLGRSFVEKDVDGAPSPAEVVSAVLTNLVHPTATRPVFSKQRMPVSLTGKALYTGELTPDAVVGAVTLPLVEGETALTDVLDATPTIDVLAESAPNTKRLSGYLLPAGLNTDQQVLFFKPASQEGKEGSIVVGGMPGSVPFPEQFGKGLLIRDDEVHIGGMTDVYVKSSSIKPAEADPIKLQPSSFGEVLFSGTDGMVDKDHVTTFYSATLPSLVSAYVGVAANQIGGLNDLVVELIDMSTANVSPTSFRIVCTVPGGVLVDGSLTIPATLAGVHWRVLRICTTSLNAPLRILQEGTKLNVTLNEMKVHLTGGFTFADDPTINAVFLSILDGPEENRGEYRVTDKALGELSIDRVIVRTGQNLHFQVYTKQNESVQLPLVRVSGVRLSGNNGHVVVPYRHPVDVVASSFAGVNNDPTTGEGTLAVAAGVLELTVLQGVVPDDIGVGDVIRFDILAAGEEYYYVIDRTNPLILQLDHVPTTLPIAGVSYGFTIGHPAVGTADLVFQDPTYFEANAQETLEGKTEFSFTMATGQIVRFRPSPAEAALVFESPAFTSSVTRTGNSTMDTSLAFLSCGLRVGDLIKLKTKVVESGDLGADPAGQPVQGQRLVLEIEGVRRSILFTTPNPVSLANIVATINQQVGNLVEAKVAGTNVARKIRLSSGREFRILDEGTPGILTTLKLTALSPGGNALSGTFEVTTIAYESPGIRITVDGALPAWTLGAFIKISRPGQQRLYPADMTQRADGLWSAPLTLTSYDPFETEVVQRGQQLLASGYKSLGYELVVGNPLYSYGTAEKVEIRVTSICMSDTASSFDAPFPLPGASVNVAYEYDATVGAIQNYMLLPSGRVAANNPLVRHYLPAYAVAAIQFTGSISSADMLKKVSAFLGSRYPNLPVEVFDLVTVLERAGANQVTFPQQMGFLTYGPDRVVRLLRSEDVVVLGKQYHIMENMDLVTIQAG